MSGKKITTYLSTAAVVLALGALVASSTANAGGDRTDCKGEGANDASMDAELRVRDDDRTKFSVSFESPAPPDGDFGVGQFLVVTVGGTELAEQMELSGLFDMNNNLVEVVGDLNFDTTAQADDDDFLYPPESIDIPPNDVEVDSTDTVTVDTLTCTLG